MVRWLPGPVEHWLNEVEQRMKASVRAQIMASMADYAVRPRPQWVRNWPAMVVLAVSAIFWSQVRLSIMLYGLHASSERPGRILICQFRHVPLFTAFDLHSALSKLSSDRYSALPT